MASKGAGVPASTASTRAASPTRTVKCAMRCCSAARAAAAAAGGKDSTSVTRVLSGAELAGDEAGSAYQLASYGAFVQAHRGQAARIGLLLQK